MLSDTVIVNPAQCPNRITVEIECHRPTRDDYVRYMTGPLDGIRVVDLTQAVAGPVGTMLLANLGATVDKIEAPIIGDLTRLSGFSKGGLNSSIVGCNRGKRSIQLDLQSDEGREIALAMCARADVIVQGMRPGVIDRLGLGYDDIRAINPRVIYCSISGFGPDGPYRDRPVYDPILQAMCGYVSLQVNPQVPFPDLIRGAIIDKAASWESALAVTAALFARERTGEGQLIDVAMVDVAIAFLWPDGGMADTMLDDDAGGGTHLSAVMNLTETADGRLAYFAVLPHQISGLHNALGHPEWNEDPRFVDYAARGIPANKKLWGEVLVEAFEQLTTAEAVAALHEHEVPVGAVVPIAEVPKDPQIIHNGTFVEWDHPTAGRIRSARHGSRFHGTPLDFRPSVPLLNEHYKQITAELT